MSIDLRKIYFPLRSNTGWFQSTDLRTEIESRLKQALIIYDELIVEDGTYEGIILDELSFDMYVPPSLSYNRTISLEKDIENTGVGLWIQPHGPGTEPKLIASGRTITRYKIDYYELLNQLNIVECDFIKYVSIPDSSLSDEVKSLILQQKNVDEKLLAQVEGHHLIKSIVAKNLNRDLIVSHLLGAGMVVDPAHSRLLEIKSAHSLQGQQFLPDKESAIVRRLLKLRVPNFQELTFPQVQELRNDGLWQAFRNNITRISSTITDNPEILLDGNVFDEVVRNAIDKSLFEEIEQRGKDGIELTTDLILGGLSFVPVIGVAADVISIVKSLAEFQEQRNGWIAFLVKASRM